MSASSTSSFPGSPACVSLSRKLTFTPDSVRPSVSPRLSKTGGYVSFAGKRSTGLEKNRTESLPCPNVAKDLVIDNGGASMRRQTSERPEQYYANPHSPSKQPVPILGTG